MKTKISILILSIFISLTEAFAQTEICGSDTITFDLSNYQYGTVQWQESSDSIHWIDIDGANELNLKYFTPEEKYIRALITLSSCEQIISDVAHIRQVPKANAGIDKKINGNRLLMTGNYVKGARGTWSFLGNNDGSATLTQQDSITSLLKGELNKRYQLVWTNTNGCGSSTDTVTVEFVETKTNKNFVIVDTTDIIKSDSAELAQGIYRIEFSDVINNINDSTLLVGIRNDGFLRKVLAYQQLNDTSYIFQTVQGYIEDICEAGVLNLGNDIVDSDDGLKSIQRLSKLPTRKELITDPKFNTGNHVYYLNETLLKSDLLKYVNADERSIEFNLGASLEINQSITLGLNGYYKLMPNFFVNYNFKPLFKLDYFKAGLNNAYVDNQISFSINGTLSRNLLSYEKILMKRSFKKLVIIGGFPVLTFETFRLKLKIETNGQGSGEYELTHRNQTDFSAYIEYYKGQKPKIYYDKDKHTTTNLNMNLEGDIGMEISLEPIFDIKLFKLAGPYFSLPINLNPKLCGKISNENYLSWGANVGFGIDAKLGFSVGVSKKLNYEVSGIVHLLNGELKIPYSIEQSGGNNQYGAKNSDLEKPLAVRVKSNLGFGVPLVPVWFELENGDGTIDRSLVFTDIKGYAQSDFKLGYEEKNQIKVYAGNCSDDNLVGGPVMFNAYVSSGGNNSCENSSLRLKTYLQDNLVSAKGMLGVKPYKYSIDKYNFSSDPPKIKPLDALNTTFYVKDALGCIATAYYKMSDPCANSILNLKVKQMGNTIEAIAKNGTPPYFYSFYENKYYSSQSVFNSLKPGDYTVYVKDSYGCKSNTSFTIKEPESDHNYGTVSDDDGLIYKTVKIGGQVWMAENLATTEFNDGTPIPLVKDASQWSKLSTPGYCWYNNNIDNKSYGALYNWYTLNTGKLCPEGWHVPSDKEWETLMDYLGGKQVAGGELKETGTAHWRSPNTGATNKTGFTALPSGSRDYDSYFGNKGYYGYWWSSSENPSKTSEALVRKLFYNSPEVKKVSGNKKDGFAVRCVKDDNFSYGGCFFDDFNDGDYTNNVSWNVSNRDDIPGSISIVNKDYVRFYRNNAHGNGGGVFLSYPVNVGVNSNTIIKFDVNPVFSDVGAGAGWKDAEYPVNVTLYLKDALNNSLRLQFCYNYRGGASANESDHIRIAFPECKQNVWLRNQQFVIQDYFPQAVLLDSIRLGGEGWDFEGYVDNVELINCNEDISKDLNSELIAYYPFSGNANDASGNDFDAEVNGPVLTSDRFGNTNSAYLFDGNKDYIQMKTKLPIKEFPVSISVWIKPYTFSDDGANYIYVSDYWDHYWGRYKGFSLILRNNGSIYAGYAATTNTSVNFFKTDSDVIKLNEWQHLVVVFSDPSDVSIYLNGVKTTVEEFNPENHSVVFSTTPDRIGFGYDGINRHSFNGIIDDVRIYSDVLTKDEINFLFHQVGGDNDNIEIPNVSFTYPESDMKININHILIKGLAWDKDGDVTSVKIKVNDGEWMDINENVTLWSKWIWLNEGDNTIYVKATDNDNNESVVKSINITTHPDVIYYKNFGITTFYYDYNSNWDNIISSLSTKEYRVGDWNDLVDYYNNGGDLLELYDGLGLKNYRDVVNVKRNGEQFYSPTRGYFASRHEHKKPSNYLAHDNIDNYLISLGSWYEYRRILLFKKE